LSSSFDLCRPDLDGVLSLFSRLRFVLKHVESLLVCELVGLL
jgi:hypothetical protein